MNWRRGALRLWIIASVLWCAVVFLAALATHNVTWLPSKATVHVKISDTEQWDYPADWGVQRITQDIEKRMAARNEEERKWAAQLPASRKAECQAIPRNTRFDDYPSALRSDCIRLFFAKDEMTWRSGWESQVGTAPRLAWKVLAETTPLALGPPLFLLALGASLFWAARGFNC